MSDIVHLALSKPEIKSIIDRAKGNNSTIRKPKPPDIFVTVTDANTIEVAESVTDTALDLVRSIGNQSISKPIAISNKKVKSDGFSILGKTIPKPLIYGIGAFVSFFIFKRLRG